jgi:CHAD domain-containing protein
MVWGQLVASGQQEAVRQTAQRIRRLARLVGRVRDRDVTSALLAPRGRRPEANGTARAWNEFLGRLREDTHTGRELLRAFLRTERQAGLFDRVEALLGLPPRADANRGLHRILADERRRRQSRVRKAHRRARRDPTSERLHRLRIRIRQWRHLATLEVAARAVSMRPPPSWQRLQDRLGRLHDLDVALATIPEDLGETGPGVRLKDSRRRLRKLVRTSLERIAARPMRATAPVLSGGGL